MVLISTYTSSVSKTFNINLCNLHLKELCHTLRMCAKKRYILKTLPQLFQVLRVIQYQEFIVFYLSHPLTVRIVIRSLLL